MTRYKQHTAKGKLALVYDEPEPTLADRAEAWLQLLSPAQLAVLVVAALVWGFGTGCVVAACLH